LQLFVTDTIQSTTNGNPFGFSVASPVTVWTKVPDTNISGHVADISVLLPGGYGAAFAVTDCGDLYVTGSNVDGERGLWHMNQLSVWTKVGANLAGNVRRVTGGPSSCTFLVTRSEESFITGKNGQGQLGLGNTVALNSWTKIETEWFAGKIICAKVVQGFYSQIIGAIVLTSSNGLSVAGGNANGELGAGQQWARAVVDQCGILRGTDSLFPATVSGESPHFWSFLRPFQLGRSAVHHHRPS
jgi:alpha-tubulin suppressor-like RCC1 family protein